MKRVRMKISVITAVYNREKTIAESIASVKRQKYGETEYIVIDGMSTDGTARVIDENRPFISTLVREPDKGIYDALNKGIRHATGDVVGFLHADDCLADDLVLQRVHNEMKDESIDGVYGDLCYVSGQNSNRLVRRWISGNYDVRKFRRGWMPPHPTVYLRRRCYEKYGLFNEYMKTAADYELMLRMMVKHQIRMKYIPHLLVVMRTGGASNLGLLNRLNANADDVLAWKSNGLRPPWGLRLTKPLRKLTQYLVFGSRYRTD